MPRSAIIDPVTFTANRTGSTRSRWRTNSDRVLPIRSRWRFDGWPPGAHLAAIINIFFFIIIVLRAQALMTRCLALLDDQMK